MFGFRAVFGIEVDSAFTCAALFAHCFSSRGWGIAPAGSTVPHVWHCIIKCVWRTVGLTTWLLHTLLMTRCHHKQFSAIACNGDVRTDIRAGLHLTDIGISGTLLSRCVRNSAVAGAPGWQCHGNVGVAGRPASTVVMLAVSCSWIRSELITCLCQVNGRKVIYSSHLLLPAVLCCCRSTSLRLHERAAGRLSC